MSSPPNTTTSSDLVLMSDGVASTAEIGRAAAKALAQGDLVAVSGTLGAGKSELCRAIVRALMQDAGLEVPSPSYTLVNVYEHQDFQIWHADLYRIGDESELLEIGLEDAVTDSVVLLEWPQRWADLPERHAKIDIQVTGADERRLDVTFAGGGWERLIGRLERMRG